METEPLLPEVIEQKYNIIQYLPALLFGQLLSLLNAMTNICNSQAPTTFPIVQNSVIYPLVFLIITIPNYTYIQKFYSKIPKHKYFSIAFGMALADVGANACIVKAFQTTSSLSAMLINSSSTVLVIIIGSTFFRIQYKKNNYIGGTICLLGLLFVLLGKAENSNSSGNSIVGNSFALMGAFGYSISNILNERLSRMEEGYPIACLSSMGFFGTIISLIFLFTVGQREISDISQIVRLDGYVWNIIYSLVMVAMYILVAKYFQKYGAILFNFNIITADLYIFIYSQIVFTFILSGSYILGLFLIMIGLVLYSTAEPIYSFQIVPIKIN
ncbi:hypothetical protein HDV01_004511 [Terramyces sp. JEL0728]|nr:hypothetical protein HDV01_004511 [Terramyces sp. JEL0728]